MQIVCTRCGRTIDIEFVFCPWCGINRFNSVNFRCAPRAPRIHEEIENSAAIPSPAVHCESAENGETRLSRDAQYEKITNMARALDALEKDLSALALNKDSPA
ncbi:MAG: hypothetical protein Pg6C_01180 [Treponemataceae bacterium]|nr:MAG: hypothetical protein Pg6C_01180 [Treponemataceae bacterium]